MLGSTLRRVLVPKTTQFARPMCQGSSVVVHNLIMPHISVCGYYVLCSIACLIMLFFRILLMVTLISG